MDQYHEYSLEDFVLDARFQRWVRYREGQDAVFWQQYLDQNPAQREDIERAKKLLDRVYRHFRTDIGEEEIDLEIQGLLAQVRAENKSETTVLPLPAKKWNNSWLIRIAAVLVIGAGLGWVTWQYYCVNCGYNGLVSGKALVERVNNSGEQETIKLSDESRVTLYPNARLSFAETFAGDVRNVYLSGEAYFQVAKDARRPFIVHTPKIVTKVLGTSFLVQANDNSDKSWVEVREGKVSVFKQQEFAKRQAVQSKSPNGMVVTPNQKLTFEHASNEMRRAISDNPEIVPSENPKSFDYVNTPASTVFDDLKEAYQIDIIFDRDVLKSCPVTASLGSQKMFSKLGILCEVIEARYEAVDGKIVIYSKGCKNQNIPSIH